MQTKVYNVRACFEEVRKLRSRIEHVTLDEIKQSQEGKALDTLKLTHKKIKDAEEIENFYLDLALSYLDAVENSTGEIRIVFDENLPEDLFGEYRIADDIIYIAIPENFLRVPVGFTLVHEATHKLNAFGQRYALMTEINKAKDIFQITFLNVQNEYENLILFEGEMLACQDNIQNFLRTMDDEEEAVEGRSWKEKIIQKAPNLLKFTYLKKLPPLAALSETVEGKQKRNATKE